MVAIFTLVGAGQALAAPGVTLGGVAILGVLVAIWLLSGFYLAVSLLASLSVPLAYLIRAGDSRSLDAKFELVALISIIIVAEFAVRALRQHQTEIAGLTEELLRSNIALQRFTADAAHELRAPLAIMRTEIDVVTQRERAGGEYRDSLELLGSEVGHLAAIADTLLLLARSDVGALEPNWAELDLRDLALETETRWQNAATAAGVKLAVLVAGPTAVRADPEMIGRLVANLIANALHQAPHGGRVDVAIEGGTATWQLRVTDTGPGVPPELREHLFERFNKAHRGRGQPRGAGLGLSLCAAIAAAHGGGIELEATGSGASFVLTVPTAPLLSSTPKPVDDRISSQP